LDEVTQAVNLVLRQNAWLLWVLHNFIRDVNYRNIEAMLRWQDSSKRTGDLYNTLVAILLRLEDVTLGQIVLNLGL
jgi:hypothetical protein